MNRSGNRAWATASSVYHWIAGVSGIAFGLLNLILVGFGLDLLNRLILLIFPAFPPLVEFGVDLPRLGAPFAIGLVGIMITSLALAALALISAVGLLGRRGWARWLSVALHGLNAVLHLIAMVLWLGFGWVVASLVPLLFLAVNVLLIIGLLLPSTVAWFDGGQNQGVGGQAPPVGPTPRGPAPTAPMAPMLSNPYTAAPAQLAFVGAPALNRVGFVAPTEVIAPAKPTLAWLVEINGANVGRQHRLVQQFTIGRNPDACDLVVEDGKVSATHARIRFEQGQFVIEDLGSTNQTTVNGAAITRQPLKDGDRIALGGEAQFAFMQVQL